MQVLAGVATVYALVFLILGYRQQGNELKQNTEALRMQAEELKNSVLQAEELVKVTRDQLVLDQQTRKQEDVRRRVMSQPSFSISELTPFKNKLNLSHITGSSGKFDKGLLVRVINGGAQANNVKFTLNDGSRGTHPHTVSKFDSGQEVNVELQLDSFDSTELRNTMLTITYRTLLGEVGAWRCGFDGDGNITNRRGHYTIYDQPPEAEG